MDAPVIRTNRSVGTSTNGRVNEGGNLEQSSNREDSVFATSQHSHRHRIYTFDAYAISGNVLQTLLNHADEMSEEEA